MATFKVCIFKHQKRQDAKYPVSIRVCWKRQYAYLKTEYYVSEKQINKKTFELKDTYLINELNSRILAFENIKVQKLGQRIDLYSARDLVKYFEDSSRLGTDSSIDFIAFAHEHCLKLESKGCTTTAKPLKSAVNAFQDYNNGRTKIPITEVTAKNLFEFADFLRGPREIKRKNQFGNTVVTQQKGLSPISVADYMTSIRTLFNAAVERYNDPDKDEIRILHYPFKKYKIDKNIEPEKRNLSAAQVRKIRDVQGLELRRSILARDLFMLSFYLLGTNLVDLYNAKASQYKNGRFSYQRKKTKDRRADNAFISIKVEPEALPLFERYKDPSGQRLFSFYKMYTTSAIFVSNVDKGLKKVATACGIEKELSTYYARHSFATIARNDCGIPKDDINLILNHSDERKGMKATDAYLAIDWSMFDRANRKVLDYILAVDELL